MRFFKHGDCLAIVIPEKLRKGSKLKDNDEFEFFELEDKAFLLISREKLSQQAKETALLKMAGKLDRIEEQQPLEKKPLPGREGEKPPAVPAPAGKAGEAPTEEQILSKGFAVIENEGEAKRVSALLERQVKKKQVLGVRGFDRKFYVVSADFYGKMKGRVLGAIGQKQLTSKELASALKFEENGCNAVLQVLKEEGELIEKRRGLYKAV